ncbi:hypothetical protein Btru_049276 [Bulinus truncatus]|nr:hypothetical protein Btru_049276 [Bulinus truncatus]
MFSKKLLSIDYSAATNIFTLCCGFFIGKGKRRTSDDAPQAPTDKTALTNGIKKTESDDAIQKSEVVYDAITNERQVSEISEKKAEENGAAYQYDHESSSDSEDEVLKHYNATAVRANSIRSLKSSRSKKSAQSGPADNTHTSSKGGHADRPASQTRRLAAKVEGVTFENQAFMADGFLRTKSGSERLTSDEHLFDVSDLQNEPSLISKCGSLEVSFMYDNAHSRVVVKIHQAREIPTKDRGGASNTQVSCSHAVRSINDKIMLLERAFLSPEGLPMRPNKKHLIFAENSNDVYAPATFPGLRDLLFQIDLHPERLDAVRRHFSALLQTIQSAGATLRDVTSFMSESL